MSVPAMPMTHHHEDSSEYRWLEKSVLKSKQVDLMEDPTRWTHLDQGEMSFTCERFKTGTQSLRLTCPTLSSKTYQGSEAGRPHGRAAARLIVNREDWSEYNRLSFWVYPTLPGFRVISMSVVLHNDGATKIPDGYAREGVHYFILKPDQWNHVVWEIGHLPRETVTALEFVYRLQGSDTGAAQSVCYDIDLVELQLVEQDHYQGWDVSPRTISFSHTGYQPTAPKIALSSVLHEHEFQVVDAVSRKSVFTGSVRDVSTPLGRYQELDFSGLTATGTYEIHAGDVRTRPFRIADDVWKSTIWKTINLFYCERCGVEIPGLHGPCHRDWLTAHDEKQIVINGGWHDAGDLSQGLVNTAESVYAMLRLSEALTDKALSDRLVEEARVGLDWVLKTRFGDGYRTTWATMDLWTDGIIGTEDDEVSPARNSPYENLIASATEALAARLLRQDDPILAQYCLKIAEEDFHFAIGGIQAPSLDLSSQLVLAAVELVKGIRLYKA